MKKQQHIKKKYKIKISSFCLLKSICCFLYMFLLYAFSSYILFMNIKLYPFYIISITFYILHCTFSIQIQPRFVQFMLNIFILNKNMSFVVVDIIFVSFIYILWKKKNRKPTHLTHYMFIRAPFDNIQYTFYFPILNLIKTLPHWPATNVSVARTKHTVSISHVHTLAHTITYYPHTHAHTNIFTSTHALAHTNAT